MGTTWLDDYWAAWNSKDPSAVGAWFAEGAVYDDVAMGWVFKGPAEVMGAVERTTKMSSDYSFETVSSAEIGDRYVAEWVVSGTHTGAFETIPATGKPYRLRGVSVGRRNEDEKITEHRDYWNVADLLIQIGILPPRS